MITNFLVLSGVIIVYLTAAFCVGTVIAIRHELTYLRLRRQTESEQSTGAPTAVGRPYREASAVDGSDASMEQSSRDQHEKRS